jgi:HEAT repeat protein
MVSASMLLSLACGGPPRRGTSGRQSPPYIAPRPAAEPPAPPPRQAVALDRGLSATARGEVAQALRSSDPLLRGQAVDALRYLPPAEASKHLLPLLDDAYRGVRFSAAMLAGERKLKDLYGPIRRLARTDTDPNVAVAARFALHKLGDRRLTHDIERLAVSQDPRVRGNVALALGLLGERSALKILRRMRLDDDPLVRQQALEAMWRLGDDDALEGLVALTASRYADDKIIGALALAGPRRQVVRAHVRGLLAGEDVHTEVSLVAARAMGMLGSDEGYKIAQDGARSKDPNQRFLAALALGAISRADAQDDLRKLLDDVEPNVRLAAASALLQLANPQA